MSPVELLSGPARQALHRRDAEGLAAACAALDQPQCTRTVLGLWRAALEPQHEAVAARALSARVGRGEDRIIGDAALRWLLSLESRDLTTEINLQSALETCVMEREGGLPLAVVAQFPRAVWRWLDGDVAALQIGAMELLQSAVYIDPALDWCDDQTGRALASKIEAMGPSLYSEDAHPNFSELVATLRSLSSLGGRRRRRTHAECVAPSFDAALEALGFSGAATSPIVDDVHRQDVVDDARNLASKRQRPLLSVRILADQVGAALQDQLTALMRICLDATEFARGDGERAELQLLAAPRASVPWHADLGVADERPSQAVLRAAQAIATAATAPDNVDASLSQLRRPVAEAALRVLQATRDEGVQLELTLTPASVLERPTSAVILRGSGAKAAWKEKLSNATSSIESREVAVLSAQVPQANTVGQVFQAVDAVVERGYATVDDIENITVDRQVDYYLQGARVLGLLDARNVPTLRGRTLAALPERGRRAVAAIYFEDSEVCVAWRQWAGALRLGDINPSSAEQFLNECAQGIGGSTIPRRASTLERWWRELAPHHPARHR